MSAEPSELAVIRPMREADIPAVMRIEQAAYDFPWTAGIFRDCLRMGYDCVVQRSGGEVVGYMLLSAAAGEAHILNLAVDPERRREGFARRLLRRGLERARELGADTLFLEVRPSNTAALRLYLAEGFRRVGRRRDYYPTADGREDALVLRRRLERRGR
ncbi:ribosomal protein S18-alanine N-acetyltransferase [Arhodomonas sp. SL1]|uniref:ribosomal protein S18-alanine N-acetyltransferase n=1 Tax=Arhodomonas sp. SL1 TaxID=3425691 RepID=UPI003F880B35